MGQCFSLDAVKHHTGQARSCQAFLRLLQKASDPGFTQYYNSVVELMSLKSKKQDQRLFMLKGET